MRAAFAARLAGRRLRRALPAGADRSGCPAGRARPAVRRPGGRPDAHGGAHHRRRDGGARRRHRAAADRGAGAAGDRCRRRSRPVAAGGRGAGGAARPRPRQVDRAGLRRRAHRPLWPPAGACLLDGGRPAALGAGPSSAARSCARVWRKPAIAPAPGRLSRPSAWRARRVAACGRTRPIERGRRTRPASCRATAARFRWSRAAIARVAQVRGTIYLNFGADRRRRFPSRCGAATAGFSGPSPTIRRRSKASSRASGAGSSTATAPRSICRPPA